MKRLIQTFADNTNLQDLAGLGRGMYKVAEGLKQSHENSNQNAFFEEKQVTKQDLQQNNYNNEASQYHETMDSHLQSDNQFYQQADNQFSQEQQKQNTEYERIKQEALQKMEEDRQRQEMINKYKKQEEEIEQIKMESLKQQKKQQEQIKQHQQQQNDDIDNEVKVKNPVQQNDFVQEKEALKNLKNDGNYNNNEQNLDFDEVFGGSTGNVGQEQKVPEGALSRVFNYGSLGFSLAGNVMKNYVVNSITGKEKPKSYVFSEENAHKISKSLCKMRGAPLKLGQMLSIQDDNLIPKEVKAAFDRARRSADIMPKSQLYFMLESELGKDWKKLFKEFDEKPVAAASIGQVHRAQLQNGRYVAVKVQYPGVKESIDSDLTILKRMMTWTGLAPKSMFIDQLIANTRAELMQECDYVTELSKQEKMRNLIKDDKRYNIPRVYPELSSERIFTSDYIVGDSLDFAADNYSQELRNDIGERIMDLTLKEIFLWRYMQTDPNPSNFFFNKKQNVLHLIDFGASHVYKKEFMDGYTELVHAATVHDHQTIIDKSIQLGFLSGKEIKVMTDAHIKTIETVGEPFAIDQNYDFGEQNLTKKTHDLIPVMLKHRIKAPPPETYSLHRKFSGAFLLNMRLKSNINCHKLFMPYYQAYLERKSQEQ